MREVAAHPLLWRRRPGHPPRIRWSFFTIIVLLLFAQLPTPTDAAAAESNSPPKQQQKGASGDNGSNGGGEGLLDDIVDDIGDFFEDVGDVIQRSAIAGKIKPLLSKMAVTPDKARRVWSSLTKLSDPVDLALLATVGWLTVPAVEIPYSRFVIKKEMSRAADEDYEPYVRDFRKTALFHVVDHVAQAARLAVLVYLADCLGVVATTLDLIKIPKLRNPSTVFAKVVYSAWAARRVQLFKRYLLFRNVADGKSAESEGRAKLGRVSIFNNLLDGVILAILALFVMDILEVEGGIALKSAFAFGSTGALVFTLASKDLASHIVNGLVLMSSDKMYEGDEVVFGDGTGGIVQKLGWMETVLRSPDENVVSVPNAQLAQQRVTNVSRVRLSQVKQKLCFRYEDADKLPKCLKDMKEEIRRSCPELITDGSRPFRAHWRGYGDDHLEVVIDAHFRIKPIGDHYFDNRQRMMEAIHRAVKRNEMEFVISTRDGGLN